MTDDALLHQYLTEGSEAAFAALVTRHLPLVHAIALRHVRDAHAAQDITQSVFVTLARNAQTLRKPAQVAAWLHQTTRLQALLHMRTESRRRHRELAALAEQFPTRPEADDAEFWQRLEPFLDETLSKLREPDRLAVILRFLQRRPIAEVASALGVSEAAAKMRLGRALDRMRTLFARHGVACTAAGLLVALERDSHALPPPGFESTVGAVLDAAVRGSPDPGGMAPQAVLPSFLARPISTARWPLVAGLGAVVGLLAILGVLRLPHPLAVSGGPRSQALAAGGSPSISSQATSPRADGPATHSRANLDSLPVEAGEVWLQVVDAATERPLPGIQVTASDLGERIGRFETDRDGGVRLPKPATRSGDFHFRLRTEGDGYAGVVASWSRYQQDAPEDVPSQLTLRLERGAMVGGEVVDADNQPVPGLPIQIRGESSFRGPPPAVRAWLLDAGVETVVTDAQGRWSFDRLPRAWERVHFQVDAPGYVETDWITEAQEGAGVATGNRLALDDLVQGQARMRVTPGLTLRGRVLDGAGAPVSGANVVRNLQWNSPGARTQTGPDGRFEMRNARAGALLLSVQAPGFAPLTVRRELTGSLDGLDLALSPGSRLMGVIVDEDGRPVPAASIEAARDGTGRKPFEWQATTDNDGRFAWDGAPAEPVGVEFGKAGYRAGNATLAPGGSPATLVLPRWDSFDTFPLAIRGMDDISGLPLPRFEVRLALDHGGFGSPKAGMEGGMTLQIPGHSQSGMVEVSAPGHAPEQVEWSGSERPAAFTVRLKPARGWSGVVLLPGGEPATGAQVALATPLRTPVLGERRIVFPDETPVATTDDAGRFHLGPVPSELSKGRVLIAVHAGGFAELEAEDEGAGLNLALQPWGRIEGILHAPEGPAPGRRLGLARRPWNPWTPGLLLYDPPFVTTTDHAGRFVFPHVPPGILELGIREGPGPTPLERRATLEVGPGQVVRVDIGGTGHPVTGTLSLPASRSPDDFRDSIGLLRRLVDPPADLPMPRRGEYPDPAAFAKAQSEAGDRRLAHWHSARGRSSWRESTSYAVRVAADGRFTAEDVPAGDYEIQVSPWVFRPIPGSAGQPLRMPGGRPLLGRFRIPGPPGMEAESPVEVGPVVLEP